MTQDTQISILLNRIATYTSVIRVRTEESERARKHSDDGLSERLQELIVNLEGIVAELEMAIA